MIYMPSYTIGRGFCSTNISNGIYQLSILNLFVGFFHVSGTQVRMPDWSSSETIQPPPPPSQERDYGLSCKSHSAPHCDKRYFFHDIFLLLCRGDEASTRRSVVRGTTCRCCLCLGLHWREAWKRSTEERGHGSECVTANTNIIHPQEGTNTRNHVVKKTGGLCESTQSDQ